ncbi:alpha-D-glucose-1-phosphate phosphatase [Fusarium tjaetaba]|uniref:Alpha-D-glucose-1-phosphate phosphatase n=1 Tax=Fusarium tjaetaba TaxID=1567544 RepID=A0A8H5RXF5_9HYPO|nr:alpha-D-glucose-1-phosphate phosphatase [Fusarium tjaetaba]KAF5641488.1 alpha-D-glucose-1-phosphate phosphatase [Fusarium tjaetaba]
MHRPNYTTVVLDLSGVLLNYTPNTVGVASTQIKSALDSPHWHKYERGKVSRQEAYGQVTQTFKIDLETWTEALEQMKDGMQPNKALISAIKHLETAYSTVKICCLSNIPGPELALLEDEIEGWGRPNEGDTWNYFHGSPTYDGTTYPDDPDTTCLAMAMIEDMSMERKVKARGVILSYVNQDSLPEAWFDKNRPRFCHCVCANVFRFFIINCWSEKLPGVYEYLCHVLETRAFLHGSRYYKIPDWILYILSDLCARCPSDEKLQRMRDLLVECVQERMGCDGNVLAAAMRVVSAQSLGLKNDRDLRTLLESQQLDGGWELAWLWSYATKPLKIGSRGVVTAVAMDAIQQALV